MAKSVKHSSRVINHIPTNLHMKYFNALTIYVTVLTMNVPAKYQV